MSLFFNKEAEANQLFTAISQNFNAISNAAMPSASPPSKLVAWILWWPASNYGPFTDGPGISINFPPYKQQLTAAAGARILDAAALESFLAQKLNSKPLYPSPNSVYIRANQTDILRRMLKDVDVVVDEARYFDEDGVGIPDSEIMLTSFLQQYGLTTADITGMKFLVNNGLLREDGVTGPDSFTEWYATAVVRPDQVGWTYTRVWDVT